MKTYRPPHDLVTILIDVLSAVIMITVAGFVMLMLSVHW